MMNFRQSLVIDMAASVALLRENLIAALTPEVVAEMVNSADLTAELEEFLSSGDQVITLTLDLTQG